MTDLRVEEPLFPRPSEQEIQVAWTALFSDPLISLSRLKAVSLSKDGLGEASPDGGVLLRSVYWRVSPPNHLLVLDNRNQADQLYSTQFYHGLLPSPTSLHLFPSTLNDQREAYNALRRRYLVAPDGRWAADCSGAEEYGIGGGSLSPGTGEGGADGWDPLSLDGQVSYITP